MEEKMKQVLYKWLEIDLVNIAKKMGTGNANTIFKVLITIVFLKSSLKR